MCLHFWGEIAYKIKVEFFLKYLKGVLLLNLTGNDYRLRGFFPPFFVLCCGVICLTEAFCDLGNVDLCPNGCNRCFEMQEGPRRWQCTIAQFKIFVGN